MVESSWQKPEIIGTLLKIIDYDIGNYSKQRSIKVEDYAEIDGGHLFGFTTQLIPSNYSIL